MHRSLIIARIKIGSEPEVAELFAESDRTDLPHVAGVRRRELYILGDCYAHVIETVEPPEAALSRAAQQPEFRRISERLRPHVLPYLPTWRGPRDAVAKRFYSWSSTVRDGAEDNA